MVFHFYNLLVMLVAIVCATMTTGVYFSTKNIIHLFIAAAALFYFADCSLAFMDDYIDLQNGASIDQLYAIPHPFMRIVLTAGVLTCVFTVVCEYTDVKSKLLRFLPTAVYVAAAATMVLTLPPSMEAQVLYYSLRQLYLLFITAFAVMRYFFIKSKSRRLRLRKLWYLPVFTLLMVGVMEAEDIFNIMSVSALSATSSELSPYVSEKSVSENLLALVFCAYCIYRAGKMLIARSTVTPDTSLNKVAAMQLESKLPVFAEDYSLTVREQEALRLLLDNMDNQNIASAMSVSLGTAKTHLNHVFKKVGVETRQELKERFWSS